MWYINIYNVTDKQGRYIKFVVTVRSGFPLSLTFAVACSTYLMVPWKCLP